MKFFLVLLVTLIEAAQSLSPPTSEINVFCVDAPACDNISFLADKEERELQCMGSMKEDCPVACGHHKCYQNVRSCKDQDEEEFFNLGMKRRCGYVEYMRTSVDGGKNKWYDRICQSHAKPIGDDGKVVEVYDTLVQDRCPKACRNIECTCADSEVPFVTAPAINIQTEEQIEGIKARTCSDIIGIKSTEYRNIICFLDIHAITSHFGSDSLSVHYMCPAACGFRKECFCRDSKVNIHTPLNKQKTRKCKDALYYPEKGKKHWCDEMKQPLFARSCPIQCKNAFCLSENVDSVDSISLNAGKTITSCWLISVSDKEYKDYCCNAFEDDLMVKGGSLCPVACADNMIV